MGVIGDSASSDGISLVLRLKRKEVDSLRVDMGNPGEVLLNPSKSIGVWFYGKG